MIDLQVLSREIVRAAGGTPMGDIMVIEFRSEFEPHGIASENFDDVWRIKIPAMNYYWQSTKGWVRGARGTKGMTFQGRNLEQTAQRCQAWLVTTLNQGLRPQWFREGID